MNTCWKCQAGIPEGQTECVACQEGIHAPSKVDEFTEVDAAALEADKHDFQRNWLEIDWDKVKTLEDLITVLKHCDTLHFVVVPDTNTLEDLITVLKHCDAQFIYKLSPGFAQVKKFTKPIDNQ